MELNPKSIEYILWELLRIWTKSLLSSNNIILAFKPNKRDTNISVILIITRLFNKIKLSVMKSIKVISEFNWNWILSQLNISCESYSEFEQSPCYQVIISFYVIYRLFDFVGLSNYFQYELRHKIKYNNNHNTFLHLLM